MLFFFTPAHRVLSYHLLELPWLPKETWCNYHFVFSTSFMQSPERSKDQGISNRTFLKWIPLLPGTTKLVPWDLWNAGEPLEPLIRALEPLDCRGALGKR